MPRIGKPSSRLRSGRTAAEWMDLLEALQIPCSPVHRLDDLPNDPHVRATGLFTAMDHPTEGRMKAVRLPVRFSRTPCEIRSPAPARPEERG